MNFVIKHATLAALILSTTAAISGCVETYSTSSGYYSSQTPPRYYRRAYNNPRPAVVPVATPVVVPVAAPMPQPTPSTPAVVPAPIPSGYSSSEQQQQPPQPLGSNNAGYSSSNNNNPAYSSGYSSR